jgi:hypothetical protein
MAREVWEADREWDEFNLLQVFQQIGAATLRKAEGQ